MNATFTTPQGHKVRTQTQRRFVLVNQDDSSAWIAKRSDKVATLRTEKTRRSMFRAVIIDTATGEVVR